uniref:Solute carrier family 43 member 3b n=1 Tax=Periophthalmus magnuspinnatus TaxID=409849 RepID=A0A3B3ZDS7_9GOBI
MLCLRSCSNVRRWLTFATGLIECLCFAGAVFGWASLVFVLKSEGYFSSLCVNSTGINGTHTLDCREQDEQFSLVFTIASFMNNFLTLPNGFLFDRFGTTVARLFGIFLYTMGTLSVAFSSAVLSNLLFPAMAFLAVGGILLLMTNMQVGNLFGARRSTIITLYNGAFDSSSALFLIVKLLHEAGFSVRALFLFLSACSVIHLLRTFFLLPRKFIPYPLPEQYTYGYDSSNLLLLRNDLFFVVLIPSSLSLFAERSFRECLLSRFFFWHLVWLSVMQLRHYLFIGTLNPMLQRLTAGEPSLVSQYINAFAVTQLCGVLCAPWNGLIMDRHKGRPRAQGETEQEADLRASVLSLALTAFQCLMFSLCATIPSLPLQYATFILQVLNRSFLYGGNAAFISVAFEMQVLLVLLLGLFLVLLLILVLHLVPLLDPLLVLLVLVLVLLVSLLDPLILLVLVHLVPLLDPLPVLVLLV